MFESEPELLSENLTKSIQMWKTLEPITIKEIIENSKIDFDLESSQYEFKKVNHDNRQ